MKQLSAVLSLGLIIASSCLFAQTSLIASFSATSPTIDGVINAAEWQNAQTYDLTFHSNVDQTTVTIPVYFLNDGTFLYCAAAVPFQVAPTAFFGLYIDGDHSHSINGTMSEPHTDLGYNKAGTDSPLYPIYDAYWAEVPPCGVLWSDMVTPPVGSEHAYTGTSELSYEFKIPLADMTAVPGETIGIHLQFSPGLMNYMYPSTDYCDIAGWPDLLIEGGSGPHPAGIELVGQYAGKSAHDIKIRGNYAYVTSLDLKQLYILNISNPATPTLVGVYSSPHSEASMVSLIDHYAYVTVGWSGFEVIDISNPALPTKVGPTYDTPGYVKDIEFANGHAFVIAREGGVRIYDVTNPANPVYVTTYSTSAWATSMAVSGNFLYVGIEHSPNGIDIFDISNPPVQNKVGSLSGTSSVMGLGASGSYAFLGLQYSGGLKIADVSNPASPSYLGSGFTTHGEPWAIAVSGDLAFLGERSYGLQIVDITNPASPALLDEYNTGGDPLWGIAVVGDHIYLADGPGGVKVLTYSEQPGWVGEINGYVMTYAFDHISGAEVKLFQTSNLIATYTTGPDGSYGFLGLPEGTYTLKTQAPGFEDGESTVNLTQSTSPLDEPIYLIIAPLDFQWLATDDCTMGHYFDISLSVTNEKGNVADVYDVALRANGRVYPDPLAPELQYSPFTVMGDGVHIYNNDYPIAEGPVIHRTITPGTTSKTEFWGSVQWQWIKPLDFEYFGDFSSELIVSGAISLIMDFFDPLAGHLISVAEVYEEIKPTLNMVHPYDAQLVSFTMEFNGESILSATKVVVSERKRYFLVKSIQYQALGPEIIMIGAPLGPGGLPLGILGGGFSIASFILYRQAADPVDSLYDLIVDPRAIWIPSLANEPSGPERTIAIEALEYLAYCSAMSISYDKLLGAIDAGSSRWAAVQGAAYGEYLRRMEFALGQIGVGLQILAPGLTPITTDDIEAFRASFLNQGPEDVLVNLMFEYGWDEIAIAKYRDAWVNADLGYMIGTNNITSGVEAARIILSSILDSLPILPIDHIACNIDVFPETIVLSDNPDYIRCYLEFENPELIEYVESTSLQLNDGIVPSQVAGSSTDFDGDGIPDLELVFSASDVLPLLELGSNVISVSGFLVRSDTAYFGAIDLVKVMSAANSGSIAGVVTHDGAGVLGVTVDLVDSLGNLIATKATDQYGCFDFDSLAAGDYTVTMIPPIGFQPEHENIPALVMPDLLTPANFSITAPDIIPRLRSRGYWMHQVNALLSPKGAGQTQETFENMCRYMELIRTHFNEHGLNPVSVFSVDLNADCNQRLQALRAVISPKPNASMNDKAKAHLTTLLLNMASGKIAQWAIISKDSATVSQAITYCNQLIEDGAPANDEMAKDIAEMINEGQVVPTNWIDPTTPDITYRTPDKEPVPTDYALGQNRPNPFNPTTEISFSLPEACHVRVAVFNILGQKIATLVDLDYPAGEHQVVWNGRDEYGIPVASGIYFYHIKAGEFVDSRKMVLMK